MPRYRKKPVVIEAMVFDGSRASIEAICRWANDPDADENVVEYQFTGSDDVYDVTIGTLEGYLTISTGDYVIRGVAGEFYPIKPDIFAATYEPVKGSSLPHAPGGFDFVHVVALVCVDLPPTDSERAALRLLVADAAERALDERLAKPVEG